MWTIIFVVLGILILFGIIVLVIVSNQRFADKSIKIEANMSEEEVREIMNDDPASMEYLKDGEYVWIYLRRYYKGWGMVIAKTEIIFNKDGKVKTIKKSEELEKQD